MENARTWKNILVNKRTHSIVLNFDSKFRSKDKHRNFEPVIIKLKNTTAMEKEQLKDKQLKYCDKLDPTARSRYKEKCTDIKGIDPYEISTKQWRKNLDLLPPVSHGDILNYLVFGVSKYTLQEFKAYKSLDSYMQFVE